ncbi:MAG: hypothetical protein ACKOFZ_07540 [Ilumatobacteraceae bacterium]
MRRPLLISLSFAVSLGLTGCATEVIEAELATTTTVAERPNPSGDVGELFDQLQDSFATMSEALAEGDRNRARGELAYVERIWDALEPQIAGLGEQFVEDARRVVDLAVTAVERNRPADAGKALRFIELVIAALPG